MSLLGKKWQILNQSDSPTLEKLLKNRGIDLSTELKKAHNPHLFDQMERVVARIEKAIANKEKIIIFGDYDVDGITASAILIHTLKALDAQVSFRLPNREKDGYGLSEKFIDEFIEKGIDLVITVDCGIACHAQVEKANKNGIDVIITDHHRIPEQLPAAHAIIHPHLCTDYPCRDLTGAGVALKVAQALMHKHLPAQKIEELESLCYQFASLGTVADLGALTDENRYIVKIGLQGLNVTRFGGLKRLKQLTKAAHMNTFNIGFQIAPRINAAGRIGDPYTALFLLLQHQENDKSMELARELETLNLQRREMTQQAIEEVDKLLDQQESASIIIESNPHWHVGILGLIAGRVAEKHNRPAIIFQDLGDKLVGSARSPKYFNIIEAISQFPKHLLSHGGHAQAAGLTVKKEGFAEFKAALLEHATEKTAGIDLQPSLDIDCEIAPEELDIAVMNSIDELEPFGMGNQKPTFLLRDVRVLDVRQVGHSKQHLQFKFEMNSSELRVIGFNLGQFAAAISDNAAIDLVVQFNRNVWNGRESLELQALDFAPISA